MPSRSTILAVSVAVFIMLFIIELLRRRKLREEYSVLWLLTGFIIVALAIWYDLLLFITRLTGLANPSATLSFFGLIFLIVINIHYSVKVSALTRQIEILAQRLALYEAHSSNALGDLKDDVTSLDR